MKASEILIVDDTPENLRLLAELLTDCGYKVRMAPSGKLALMNAKVHPPDLILLDILMPNMDGFEVCRRLKATGHLADIPIIFISALDETFDKVTAFSVGGVDYITKPFHVDEVVARVQTHLSLRKMQQSLEEQNQELKAYAHTVAHDLKNPISVILGFAGYLSTDFENMTLEQIKGYLGHIVNGSQKMIRIIDDLLLLANIRQLDDIELKPLNMGTIVEEALAHLSVMINEYQAEIIVPDHETWPVAMGYGTWIEEVWSNYISNAIKYGGTPPQIELGAVIQTNDMACFWVRDNGAGISREKQDVVFSQFTRLDEARAQGHGLGLSIVKRIIERLNGQVSVESAVDKGTVFNFTLPLSN